MALETMHDLLVDELRDIYSAEQQLVKALPKMAKAAKSAKLKQAITAHLSETKGQVERLDRVFDSLGVKATGKKCHGMEGLVEEGDEIAKDDGEDAVRDAGIIGAAQRVEHYEMAAYGTAIAFAEALGETDIIPLLTENRNEEEAADKKLTMIAESEVNPAALEASSVQADGE